MNMRVVVFGPTGAVGAEVVRQALADPRIEEVTAVSRRPLSIDSRGLVEVLHDNFLDLEPIADRLSNVDACFYCLGVSQLQVKDPDRYREITYGFTMEAARQLVRRSPELHFHFLSGSGADPTGRSRVLFARVKGETETALARLPVPKLTIWRPGYINPMEPRTNFVPTFEKFARPMYPVLRRLLPWMTTDTVEIARAMLQSTFEGAHGNVVDTGGIRALARRYGVPA